MLSICGNNVCNSAPVPFLPAVPATEGHHVDPQGPAVIWHLHQFDDVSGRRLDDTNTKMVGVWMGWERKHHVGRKQKEEIRQCIKKMTEKVLS